MKTNGKYCQIPFLTKERDKAEMTLIFK